MSKKIIPNFVKKTILIFSWLVIFLLVKSLFPVSVNAQYFKLEKVNPGSDVSCDTSFKANILINTNNIETLSADALVKYDPAKITVNFDKAISGNFYTYFVATPIGGVTDKALISSWEESVAHPKKAATDTLFATLDLTTKTAGSTTLSFDCAGTTGADSNINRASDYVDFINCSLNNTLTVTIGSCSGPTLTPIPTNTSVPSATSGPTVTAGPSATVGPTADPTIAPTEGPTATPLPTPTKKPTNTPVPTRTPIPTVSTLPRAGMVGATVTAVGIGVVLTIIGILFIV